MDYVPNPVDTQFVQLPPEIDGLTEKLAENAHDIWARQRMQDGWSYGKMRDDTKKQHPCLVPYMQLPESEKQYDRNTAVETLKMICALGYKIIKE